MGAVPADGEGEYGVVAATRTCDLEKRNEVLEAEAARIAGDEGYSLDECQMMLAEKRAKRLGEQ